MIERFPVEEGHVRIFAEAIGDADPAYRGPSGSDRQGTPGVAPPTFTMASAHFDPDYPLRPKIGEPWFGSGSTPSGVEARQGAAPNESQGGGSGGPASAPVLHAEQHFEFARPVYVGDVLHAETKQGRTWTKEGRSGTLHFGESVTEFFDEHDQLVVTARSVGVRTELGASKEKES